MLVLGVTGGIGAGKSTVARLLAERGARVLDADVIVRELYAKGELPRRIAARFGEAVLAPDGSVDRAALARVAFADDAARRDLEALVHPEVRRRVEAALSDWRREGFAGIAVVDAALLVEAEPPYRLDALLVVSAPEDVRVARLEARGVPRAEARRRMSAQVSDAARAPHADVLIVNDGALDELARRVDEAMRELGRDGPARSGYTGPSPKGAGGGSAYEEFRRSLASLEQRLADLGRYL
jgi:dephospho-CoA kinase